MGLESFKELHNNISKAHSCLAQIFELPNNGQLNAYSILNSEPVNAALVIKKEPYRSNLVPGKAIPAILNVRIRAAELVIDGHRDSLELRLIFDQITNIIGDPKTEKEYFAWVSGQPILSQGTSQRINKTSSSNLLPLEFEPTSGFRPDHVYMFGWQVARDVRELIGRAIGSNSPLKVAKLLAEVLNIFHYYAVGGQTSVTRDNINRSTSTSVGYTDGYGHTTSTSQSSGSSWNKGVPNTSAISEVYTLAVDFSQKDAGSPIENATYMKVLRDRLQPEADLRIATWLDQNSVLLQKFREPIWKRSSSPIEIARSKTYCGVFAVLAALSQNWINYDLGILGHETYILINTGIVIGGVFIFQFINWVTNTNITKNDFAFLIESMLRIVSSWLFIWFLAFISIFRDSGLNIFFYMSKLGDNGLLFLSPFALIGNWFLFPLIVAWGKYRLYWWEYLQENIYREGY